MRFGNFNQDGCDTLMFNELARELSMVGFLDSEKLQNVFSKVDLDGSGCLDFPEFLLLLHVFSQEDVGPLLSRPQHSR